MSDADWFLTAAGLLSGCKIQTCFEAACHAWLTTFVICMIQLALLCHSMQKIALVSFPDAFIKHVPPPRVRYVQS